MSKKKYNTENITNELEGGASLFFQRPSQQQHEKNERPVSQPVDQPVDQSTGWSIHKPLRNNHARASHQPINQSISQPTNQSIKQSTRYSRVLNRPKAFYITERLDKRLDEAVRYFEETHGIRKVDRSIIVNALLDNEANWAEEALDLLVDRVISQLTSRLTGK